MNGTVQIGELRGVITGPEDAPVVVLLHGNGESHRQFTPVTDALSNTFRVIALDSRGHGESPRGKGPLTIERMAEDVKTALDDLGVNQANLVGFSDGGNIALAFAAQHPERVQSLVAYGANLNPNGVNFGLRWQARRELLARRIGGLISPRLKAKADITALVAWHPNIDPESLSVVTAPALIVAGENDVIIEDHTRAIAAALPNGTCLIVPGADHFLPYAEPARFAEIVREFLDGHLA